MSEVMLAAMGLLLGAQAHAQSLTVDGACGGDAAISVEGLTPGGGIVLLGANGSGTAIVPVGACAGKATDLHATGLQRVVSASADPFGTWSLLTELPVSTCGMWIQVLDLDSCRLSNAVSLDSPPLPCQLDSFEGGEWPGPQWTEMEGGGSISTDPVYFGSYAVTDPGWSISRMAVDISDTVEGWFYLGGGRSHLGFDSSEAGTKSFVLAPNTGQILFERNEDFGFETVAAASLELPLAQWLRTEVRVLDPTHVWGGVYDADGILLATLEAEYPEGHGRGTLGMRAYGGSTIDQLGNWCR
jgi:hypothetical protein